MAGRGRTLLRQLKEKFTQNFEFDDQEFEGTLSNYDASIVLKKQWEKQKDQKIRESRRRKEKERKAA